MPASKKTVLGLLPRIVGGLRFPQLFLLTLLLFLVDLVIPDLIPFVDEILLGLASLLLASWKRKPDLPAGEDGSAGVGGDGLVIDVEPEK
jgi:hypothetical protein